LSAVFRGSWASRFPRRRVMLVGRRSGQDRARAASSAHRDPGASATDTKGGWSTASRDVAEGRREFDRKARESMIVPYAMLRRLPGCWTRLSRYCAATRNSCCRGWTSQTRPTTMRPVSAAGAREFSGSGLLAAGGAGQPATPHALAAPFSGAFLISPQFRQGGRHVGSLTRARLGCLRCAVLPDTRARAGDLEESAAQL